VEYQEKIVEIKSEKDLNAALKEKDVTFIKIWYNFTTS
jgi:hypothetical protein